MKMPPSNAMENDKKRLRNQFTKDERSRLLAIMTEYGPLLDDKNISILSRKEIWEIIENKFNEHGHSGRTSAQLKKYWQNYKYHSKRAKIIDSKQVPKTLSPVTKQMVRMLAKANTEDWARYDVNAVAATTETTTSTTSVAASAKNGTQFSTGSNSAVSDSRIAGSSSKFSKNNPYRRSLESLISAASGPRDSGSETTERDVLVPTSEIPGGSSVTVSVICPEVQSRVRSVFLKRNIPSDKFRSSGIDDVKSPPDSFRRSELLTSGVSCEEDVNISDTKNVIPLSGKFFEDNYGMSLRQRSTPCLDVRGGILAGDKSERSIVNLMTVGDSDKGFCWQGEYRQVPPTAAADDRFIRCVAVPRRILTKNQSSVNITGATTSLENQSKFIGNVPPAGVVKEIPVGKDRLERDSDSVESLRRSRSIINGENEIIGLSIPGDGGDAEEPCSGRQILSRANRAVADFSRGSGGLDYPNSKEIQGRFNPAETPDDREEIPSKTWAMLRADFNRGADTARIPKTQNPSWFKLYLRLLREIAQPGKNREVEAIRKFDTVISAAADLPDESYPDEHRDTGLDEGRNSETLVAPDEDQFRREIKVETEEGSAIADQQGEHAAANAVLGDDLAMDPVNRLTESKLRRARSELDHRLKLQKLETAEKELRLKIAEMTVGETRLRIQALVEERLRAKEIHDLRLAQIATENARSQAERGARIEASNVQRDPECCGNFYHMQLRYTSGSVDDGNGVDAAGQKHCQQ